MLGGIGHALVPAVEEAMFFHAIARRSQTNFQIKGGNPLTENYSIFKPEVLDTDGGSAIAQKNSRFLEHLLNFDAVVIAGQAKSHCVAWTIDDLLNEIKAQDETLSLRRSCREGVCGSCAFNIDGTMMMGAFDTNGNMYGVTDDHSDSWDNCATTSMWDD